MKYFGVIFAFLFFSTFGYSQSYHFEPGVEVQAASFSTHGGTVGGALKFAFVNYEELAFGPTLRFQYIWSKSHTTGTQGSRFTWGAGGFFHYRFMGWFYLGAELEYLKNPYVGYNQYEKRWVLTSLLGGGVSRDFGPVHLNAGILYDIAEPLRGEFTELPPGYNSSPLRTSYFMKINDPKKPGMGYYIPLLYRITLFIPLNKNKNEEEDDFDRW